MASMRIVTPAAACGLGAILFLVPYLSPHLPPATPVSLAAFWLAAWYLDARFTARHWAMVVNGREYNILVRALAGISPRRRTPVLLAHAGFSVGAAAGLQALATHSLDFLVMSCILAVFGVLHVDALHQSRKFVRKVLESQQDGSGSER